MLISTYADVPHVLLIERRWDPYPSPPTTRSARWVPITVLEAGALAFDHNTIIERALDALATTA